MKTKVTRGQMYRNFGKENIVALGYCTAASLLNRFTPSYYCSGVYGWNADIYVFDNYAICTGYRPFGTYKEEFSDICYKYTKRLNKATYKGKERVIKNFLKELFDELKK